MSEFASSISSIRVESGGTYEFPEFVDGKRTIRLDCGSTPETTAEVATLTTVKYGSGELVEAPNTQEQVVRILHKDDSTVVEAGTTYLFRTIDPEQFGGFQEPFDVFQSYAFSGQDRKISMHSTEY